LNDFFRQRNILGTWETYFTLQGTHAQNYHIFTPAEGKDWCMVWGPAQWLKELPHANAACAYNFKPGQPGHLVLEFWITPFDYAGAEGPQRAVESVLKENKIIGLSWAVIDYDDVHSGDTNNGFWNLSRQHTMYGNADQLVAFKLMPLEPLPQTLRSPMVVPGRGHGPAARRLQGPFHRQNHLLEMGFRRRRNFSRTKPGSHLQGSRALRRRALGRRAGGQIAPGQSLGRGGEMRTLWRRASSVPVMAASCRQSQNIDQP
jgi:hypothetical protein